MEPIAAVLVAREASAAVSMSAETAEAAAAEIWIRIFFSMDGRV